MKNNDILTIVLKAIDSEYGFTPNLEQCKHIKIENVIDEIWVWFDVCSEYTTRHDTKFKAIIKVEEPIFETEETHKVEVLATFGMKTKRFEQYVFSN